MELRQKPIRKGTIMENTVLFNEYYRNWIDVYKQGAVREVTLNKYHMTEAWQPARRLSGFWNLP